VDINKQIGVNDPGPHLSIARTYSQLGEFFAAARNVQKALEYEPTNADIYGQLGIVYFRSRNYEGSIYSFECAIRGCSGEASCLGRGLEKCNADPGFKEVDVNGLALEPNTIVYYYTYGSVLAALSRSRDNNCDEARDVFDEVTAELNNNPEDYADGRETIVSIVQAGESICDSLDEGGPPPTAVPTNEAGAVISEVTATPTP
ncbi:MAG: tetratricopeptide repeat protein, partial [Anaerolineales bacterium]